MEAGTGPSFDPRRLLAALVSNGVDFVVIGGMAGSMHGSAFITFDLDVMYSRVPANLERMAVALRELEARLFGPNLPPDLPFQLDAKTLANGANFTFDTKFGRFDILADPSGAPPYEVVKERAEVMTVMGVEVAAAHLEHLMAMKRAAGRPKDLSHIAEYADLLDLAREQEGT